MSRLAGAFLLLTMFLVILSRPSGAFAGPSISEDRFSAVLLVYHRIGEDNYPDMSLRTDQFALHLRKLLDGNHTVMALPAILTAVRTETALPPRTVGITFEGAYRSAYENAMSLLLEHSIPFTVFVAADQIDNDSRQFMSWGQLRRLKDSGLVSFGILPASYTRLSGRPRQEILKQINKSRIRLREELEIEAGLFSYPFGEYSLEYKNLVQEQRFSAAFGLHSGAIHPLSDFYALPRFTLTELYGDVERFDLVAGALPLPAYDAEPQDPALTTANPAIGFTLPESLASSAENLSCFISGQAQPLLEILGESRIELRLREPLAEERIRVNCTMPGPEETSGAKSWRWYGMLLFQQDRHGGGPSNQPPDELRQPPE